jgi:hyperosmotically inducible protein
MNSKRQVYRVVVAALTAGVVGSASATATSSEPEGMANPDFKKYDVNRDGYVSHEESQKIRDFSKAFKEADDNRDGKLDADEFIKAQAIHDRIRAGQYVDDSVITARVKAALVKDPAVSARAVSVKTHKGVVLLSGFVENDRQARRATEVAAGVQGVVSVKNGLAVKS